jgi:hypothetical protein
MTSNELKLETKVGVKGRRASSPRWTEKGYKTSHVEVMPRVWMKFHVIL